MIWLLLAAMAADPESDACTPAESLEHTIDEVEDKVDARMDAFEARLLTLVEQAEARAASEADEAPEDTGHADAVEDPEAADDADSDAPPLEM